jgi:hypothetical protein
LFPLPFGRWPSLLGPSFPAVGFGLPCGWLTAGLPADHVGVSTFCASETRLGWTPFVSRGRSVSALTTKGSSCRRAGTGPVVLAQLLPCQPSRFGNLPISGPHQGFTCVRPSSLSLARKPLDSSGVPWAFPHAPDIAVTRMPVGAGNHRDTGGADPSAIHWCNFVSRPSEGLDHSRQ